MGDTDLDRKKKIMVDEFIRKQDAVDMCGGYGCLAHLMSTIKPADVAPVVRCRECENWDIEWKPIVAEGHYCVIIDRVMKPNDFCSYGESK